MAGPGLLASGKGPNPDGDVRIVLMGRQGSGKGTQAARLSVLYGVPHISTGEAFRAAARNGTELGRSAQSYMDRGELVPDDLVMAVVQEHLLQGKAEPGGFVLDGVPRNVSQAETLAAMLGPKGLDVVVNMDVSIEVVVRRIAGRRVCSNCGTNCNVVDNPTKVPGICDVCGGTMVQRDDDTEEAVRRRLQIYESVTAPLVDWYGAQGLLATVDALGDPDEVTKRVVAAVEAARSRKASAGRAVP
jgi:adenylate kinase